MKKVVTIALNRGSGDNTITGTLVDEIDRALSEAEADPAVRVVVLKSEGGVFSAGLDFRSLAGAVPPREPDVRAMVGRTFSLLKRFTRTSKIVVAQVDGAAKAGGVGLAAACDVVIASERATFGLSEALFGLLPAAIAPFLMRRVGFQKTSLMTLTTQTIDAREALRIGLVDELATDADESLRRLLVRVDRVQEKTVATAKQYFARLWPLTDQVETEAVRLSASLICDPENLEGIRAFVERQELPWQKSN